MARFLVVLLVVFLMAMPGIVFAGDTEAVAEKGPFDDWYGMLETQAGTTFDFKTETFRPYVAGRVLGYRKIVCIVGTEIDADETTEAKGPVAWLAGVTYNLGNLKEFGVDAPWMENFGFNFGVCGTYEFANGDVGWRAVVSIIDLSFDKGNAERQRSH